MWENIRNPIPECSDPDLYVESDFKDSGFVEINSNKYFDVEMQYPLLEMVNAEEKCYVRREVYEKLILASSFLPNGYSFKIYDAWRPFALQHELYEKYSQGIIQQFGLEQCEEEQIKRVVHKFVSDPVYNVEIPPVHTTGGAVDLTIVDIDHNELEMGSKFDEFTDRTYTDYYEKEKNTIIRNNRRMLYNIMINVGFTNLPSEWWH